MTDFSCVLPEIRDSVVVLTVAQPRGADEYFHAELLTILRKSMDEGYTKFIIDLSHTLTLGQAMVGELVCAYTTISRQAGALALVDATERITGILRAASLHTILAAFDDLESAIRYLSDPGPPTSTVRQPVQPKPGPRPMGEETDL